MSLGKSIHNAFYGVANIYDLAAHNPEAVGDLAAMVVSNRAPYAVDDAEILETLAGKIREGLAARAAGETLPAVTAYIRKGTGTQIVRVEGQYYRRRGDVTPLEAATAWEHTRHNDPKLLADKYYANVVADNRRFVWAAEVLEIEAGICEAVGRAPAAGASIVLGFDGSRREAMKLRRQAALLREVAGKTAEAGS